MEPVASPTHRTASESHLDPIGASPLGRVRLPLRLRLGLGLRLLLVF